VNLDALIGERVKKYRTKIGISQAALGGRLEAELGAPWTRQTVWEAETGKRSFKVVELIALARVVRQPVHFFVIPGDGQMIDWPGDAALTAADLKDLFRTQGTKPSPASDARRVMQVVMVAGGMLDTAIENLKLMDEESK
jgi:transcriptional regulator with XRE-family HTH domain